MNPTFYVYVYLDPTKPGDYNYGKYHFDYNPFYVGKGSNGRFKDHLKDVCQENNKNEHFINTIKKIKRVCNTIPIIVKYQEMLLEQDSFDLEIKMIATIGRYDLKRGPLCNLTDGGEGSSGYKHTEETKRKISESEKGKIFSVKVRRKISITKKSQNIKMSDETKEKIRKARTGMKLTEVAKEKVRQANIGKKATSEARRNMSKAQIKRFALTRQEHIKKLTRIEENE